MKIKQLQNELKKKKIDFALFINLEFDRVEPNIAYFSDYYGAGALVVPKEKKSFLVVPLMEYERAKKSRITVLPKEKDKRISETISNAIKRRKIGKKRIAVDKSFLTVSTHNSLRKAFKKAKTHDISQLCAKLMATKTPEEIARIKKACKISDKVLGDCLGRFKNFKTENEAKSFLEHEARKNGCELAFPIIVASGRNSRMPHFAGEGKIKNGFCVIDFGVKYKGYCSDTTRTIYIGKPTKKEQEMYAFMLNVQKKLIEKIKPGMKCSKLYDEAATLLGKNKRYFTHGLGHGLGIKVHELPNLTYKSKDILTDRMVFTIEPGIYLKSKGIRIEDTILLDSKAEALTKIPKDLLVIP